MLMLLIDALGSLRHIRSLRRAINDCTVNARRWANVSSLNKIGASDLNVDSGIRLFRTFLRASGNLLTGNREMKY